MTAQPRAAKPSDAEQLTQLHVEAGLRRPVSPQWLATHADDLARRLRAADPSVIAVVVDAPDERELASAAVGFVHRGLSRPGSPHGLSAHLSSLATHVRHRRSGYATAAATAFVMEATRRGCAQINLYAVPGAVSLYTRLGFTATPLKAMTLQLPESAPPGSATASEPWPASRYG